MNATHWSDRTAILAAILIAGTASLAGQQLSFFHGRRDYPIRNFYSHRLVVGDFNGDGNPDLIPISSSGEMGVFLGNGKGGFLPGPRSEPLTDFFSYSAVVAADFTGDGKLDLLSSTNSTQLALRFGDGRGGFGATVIIPSFPTFSFAVGDFNEDERPDILARCDVLLNTGNGTFLPASRTELCGGAIEDVNGDGHQDIVTHNGFGRILASLGSGTGTFQPPVRSPSAFEGVNDIQIGNVNKDSIPDILTFRTEEGVSTISTFIGTGDGRFRQERLTNLTTWFERFAVGDLNRDGLTDVISAGQGMMVIRLGKGDGTFGTTEGPPIPGKDSYSAIIVTDVNADGKQDVVMTAGRTAASVFLGNGDGTLREPPSLQIPPGTSGAAKGDFNRDGLMDIAFSNASGGTVSVLATSPNGGLVKAGVSTAPDAGGLYPGDFNGDAKPDLLSLSPTREAISVLLGKGDGTFDALQPIRLAGLRLSPPSIGDFNNDSKTDIIVGSITNNRFLFFAGNGDGTFRPRQIFNVPVASLRAFTAGDFNLDRKLDLAVSSLGQLWILGGNGDGTFQPPVSIERGVQASEMLAADVNNDSRPDIITSESASTRSARATLRVVLGKGDGTFHEPENYFAGTGHGRSITFSDLNNDGNPDIFFVDHNEDYFTVDDEGHNVVVLLGKGDGTFLPAQFFAAGRSPLMVAEIRFNLDAYPDLAVVNKVSHSVTLLINHTGLNPNE